MAFVVETGAGLVDSNAYASEAFVDGYHSDRGNTKWVGSASLKQACIIRATDYIEKRFGARFRGMKWGPTQSLEWPRLGAYDDDDYSLTGVPKQLQQATAEYALRALLLGELAPDVPAPVPPQNNASGSSSSSTSYAGPVKLARSVVGPIEEEFEYSETRSQRTDRAGVSSFVNTVNIPEYPAADLLMRELCKSSNSIRMVRG